MRAVIYLDNVPEWQIGQTVLAHFPDSMCKKGVCEAVKTERSNKMTNKEWLSTLTNEQFLWVTKFLWSQEGYAGTFTDSVDGVRMWLDAEYSDDSMFLKLYKQAYGYMPNVLTKKDADEEEVIGLYVGVVVTAGNWNKMFQFVKTKAVKEDGTVCIKNGGKYVGAYILALDELEKWKNIYDGTTMIFCSTNGYLVEKEVDHKQAEWIECRHKAWIDAEQSKIQREDLTETDDVQF